MRDEGIEEAREAVAKIKQWKQLTFHILHQVEQNRNSFFFFFYNLSTLSKIFVSQRFLLWLAYFSEISSYKFSLSWKLVQLLLIYRDFRASLEWKIVYSLEKVTNLLITTCIQLSLTASKLRQAFDDLSNLEDFIKLEHVENLEKSWNSHFFVHFNNQRHQTRVLLHYKLVTLNTRFILVHFNWIYHQNFLNLMIIMV